MDPFDFNTGANIGSAGDYGTGFGAPPAWGITPPPMMPWTGGFPGQDLGDPAASFAAGLAAKGIRPQQFLSNPQAAARSMAPALPPLQNDWDPTPVDTPGGGAVSLPGRRATVTPSDASVTLNVDPAKPAGETPGADAQAAAKPEDKGGDMAKRLTDALRGVRMPTPPQPQTIRTPQAPQPHAVNAIKSGQLLALLQSLGVNPAAAKVPALGGMLRG